MSDEIPLATAEPFRVPTAPCRPGDESVFAPWTWTPEDLHLLNIDCSAEESHDHAYGLLRVLGDDGKASGAWNPELDEDTLKMGLEHMLRLRIFDERMMKLQETKQLVFDGTIDGSAAAMSKGNQLDW